MCATNPQPARLFWERLRDGAGFVCAIPKIGVIVALQRATWLALLPPEVNVSRLLRIARQHVTIWVITGVWMSLIIVAMIVTLGRRKDTLGTAMIRTWGRMVLSAVQVELRVSPEVQAEFAERRARIVVFNHTSTLDLAIGAAMTPEGGVPVVKRELTRLPILGQVILLTDVLRVDRSNRAATVASLKAAAQRICGERLSVLIAPEGTRSDTGDLGQFKSGPFHLAVQSGAPIVPLVTHGVTAVWPRGAKCSVAGEVRIELLPIISSEGRTADDVRAMADGLRAAYLRAL